MTWSISEATAYGGVLLSRSGLVLLREPANHFDGYVWTFAKGRLLPGDTPEQTALREVREETGFDAEILDALPGAFKGGTTTNAYFVMHPTGQQAQPDWETSSTRWVSLDEAQRLIGQTTNSIGRARDLAVLEAARRWFEANQARVPAIGKDWRIEAMPVSHVRLALDFELDAAEAAAIRLGYVPAEMEQKWFAFFEGSTLYQHRSWTGYCIDQIHFVEHAGGLRATHAEVNRDPEQYSNTDDAEDIRRIEEMVRSLAKHNQKPLRTSGFQSAFELACQPNYLGAPEVVHQLLAGWFDVVLRCLVHEATAAEEDEQMMSLVRIMTEDETGYVRMPGWHTADQLGKAIVQCFGLDEEYCAGESLAMIVSEGLAAVHLAIWALSKPMLEQKLDADAWQQQLAELLAYVVSVFLGTHSVQFPGKTLQQMAEPPGKAKRLAAFKFADVGLQPGTVLTFKLDPAVQCVVAPDNRVEFLGQLVSLSRAAVRALRQAGRTVTAARGPDYWYYRNMSLTEYRKMMQEGS